MSLTYPHSCTLGTGATTLTFADGMVLTIASGTFTSSTSVTVDKITAQAPAGQDSVSACYTLEDSNGDSVAIEREITVVIPTTEATSGSVTYDLYYNPQGHHSPEGWLPTEDGPTRESTYLLAGVLPHWADFEATKR